MTAGTAHYTGKRIDEFSTLNVGIKPYSICVQCNRETCVCKASTIKKWCLWANGLILVHLSYQLYSHFIITIIIVNYTAETLAIFVDSKLSIAGFHFQELYKAFPLLQM